MSDSRLEGGSGSLFETLPGPEGQRRVHINSAIHEPGFYLAREGAPTGRPGLSVKGSAGEPGPDEKVFYRTVTQLLPAICDVRRGASGPRFRRRGPVLAVNSAAERAVTQAWTAVGVNDAPARATEHASLPRASEQAGESTGFKGHVPVIALAGRPCWRQRSRQRHKAREAGSSEPERRRQSRRPASRISSSSQPTPSRMRRWTCSIRPSRFGR